MTKNSNIDKAISLMENSLFLLGAGATMDAGCLVSSQMLTALDKMSLSVSERDAIDFLISSLEYHATWKRRKELSKEGNSIPYSPNIEDLMLLIRRILNRDSYLPYPVTGSWADKIHLLESAWQSEKRNDSKIIPTEAIPSLFENLQVKITQSLPDWLMVDSAKLNYLDPWKNYLSSTPVDSPKLNVFTLNYDLVFENYFNGNDVNLLDNGFSQNEFAGFRDSDPTSFRIRYHKLHGSLNWFKDDKGRIREMLPEEYLGYNIPNPLIIFGHGSKFLSVDPFISLLYQFKENLLLKKCFFVIGYSFFDPYINNLILEGLSKDGPYQKKLIVIDPGFSKKKFLTESELKAENSDHLLKNRFVDFVESVQQSAYLSDLPEFNIREISPEKIVLIEATAAKFFGELFSENFEYVGELYNDLLGKDDVFS